MLAKLLVAPLFIAASAVAHPAVQVQRRADVPLSQWSSSGLEQYWRYKVRYNSLGCASQTGTDFYNNCCSPLGASESLSDRPAECTPASLTCSGSTFSTLSAPPTTPEVPSSDNNNVNTNTGNNSGNNSGSNSGNNNASNGDVYDENNLPWCEEGQDEYEDEEYETNDSTPDTNTPTDNGNTDNGNNNNNNNNGGGSASGQVNGGQATWYMQNGVAGACGDVHGEGDFIGAIQAEWYGDFGQKSQYCGRTVRITNTNNGNTIDIIVADVCPTCRDPQSFDLSQGAFSALNNGDLGAGVFPISWSLI